MASKNAHYGLSAYPKSLGGRPYDVCLDAAMACRSAATLKPDDVPGVLGSRVTYAGSRPTTPVWSGRGRGGRLEPATSGPCRLVVRLAPSVVEFNAVEWR